MKIAKANAPAAPTPEERNQLQFLLESIEEMHEKVDALAWCTDIPKEVTRELKALKEVLTWRCMTVFEQRLARMEATLERIERRLP